LRSQSPARPPWCAEGEKEGKTTKREAAHRRKRIGRG
jgi:hypothetical protein